jgi:hypothetical protein
MIEKICHRCFRLFGDQLTCQNCQDCAEYYARCTICEHVLDEDEMSMGGAVCLACPNPETTLPF